MKKKIEKTIKIPVKPLNVAEKVEVVIPVMSLSVAKKSELLGSSPKLQKWFEELEQVRKNPEMLKHVKKAVDLGELELKEEEQQNE